LLEHDDNIGLSPRPELTAYPIVRRTQDEDEILRSGSRTDRSVEVDVEDRPSLRRYEYTRLGTAAREFPKSKPLTPERTADLGYREDPRPIGGSLRTLARRRLASTSRGRQRRHHHHTDRDETPTIRKRHMLSVGRSGASTHRRVSRQTAGVTGVEYGIKSSARTGAATDQARPK